MGRVRAGFVTRVGDKLLKMYGASFTPDFSKNKIIVSSLADVPTKKFRNLIAGYITKQIKIAKD